MKVAEPLAELFPDLSFEDLESALRQRKDLTSWSSVFGVLVARVSTAIRRRFADTDLADEAAQSACRTFIRQLREGRLELKCLDDMVGLLVQIAFCKASRQARLRLPGGEGPAEASPPLTRNPGDEPGALPDAEVRRRLVEAMTSHLKTMLQHVEESLKKGLHRDILPYWFAREYEGHKISNQRIGRQVGCSRGTVDRVCREISEKWRPLVAEGQRAVRELAWHLGQGEA